MRSMILSAGVAALVAVLGGLVSSGAAAVGTGADIIVAQGLGGGSEGVQKTRELVARELRKMSDTMSDLASGPVDRSADPMMARRIEQEQANLSVIAAKLRTEADRLAYPSTSGAEARNELEQALKRVESLQESVRERQAMASEAIRKSGGEKGELHKLLSSAAETLSKKRVQALREKL